MPATYLITAPDGRKFRVTGDGSKEEALAHFQQQYSQPAQPEMENGMPVFPDMPGEGAAPSRPSGNPFTRYLSDIDQAAGKVNAANGGRSSPVGTMEALGTMLSGAVAAPVGSLAGIGTEAARGLGLTDAKGEDIGQAVQNAMTYQPRTESGKAKLGLLGAVAAPITESGADIALAPLAAEAQALRIPARVPKNAAAPNTGGAGARVGESLADAVPAGPNKAGLAQDARSPAQAAIADGYKLKPSEAGGRTGTVVEGLTGSAKLETALVKKNQRNTDRLAREEFGLPEGPVTRGAVEQAKGKHNRVYAEVGQKLGEVKTDATFKSDIESIGRTPGTSFKDDVSPAVENLKKAYVDESRFNASDAVQKVRQLRYKANKNIGGRDAEVQELGFAQKAIADAIERQMDRHGKAIGQDKLMTRFSNARQELAKLNSLQAATQGGEVNALILKRQMEKGVPLSGNLRKIAEHASNFENVMRPGRKVKGNTPVNMWETAMAAGGAVAGAAAHPFAAAPLLVGAATRPLARGMLMSGRYQRSLGKVRNALAEPAIAEAPKRNALLEY